MEPCKTSDGESTVSEKMHHESKLPSKAKIRSLRFHLYTLWLFTCNDFKVIVWPHSIVGVLNALTGTLTTNSTPVAWSIFCRLPLIFFWNWINLLTFNLANQRLENSIIEDTINKPFRPIPSQRISAREARHLLLFLIPIGLAISAVLGVLRDSTGMAVLTWMYNDLGGADEDFKLRNFINACGFFHHNSGSTLIGAGLGHQLTKQAYTWFTLIGAVIFTTLQVQDLPDMEGDALRGRGTLPLVYGEWVGRWSVAIPVLIWSIVCPSFWGLGFFPYIFTLALGLTIATRVLLIRNEPADQITYKIWCLWLIGLYSLPFVRS